MNKKIITPALAVMLSLAINVGSTYALFTSEDEATIKVKTGSVDVEATIDNLELYSPKLIDPDTLTITDDTNIATETNFSNGGEASISDTGVLSLSDMACGDAATFDIELTNNSNIAIKYRVIYEDVTAYPTPAPDTKLIDGLEITVGGESIKKVVVDWTDLEAEGTIDALEVKVTLPCAAGDAYQELSTDIKFTVEAVQSNAFVELESTEDPVWWNRDVTEEVVSVATNVNFAKTYTPVAGELTWSAPEGMTAYLNKVSDSEIILTYSLNGQNSISFTDEDCLHFGFYQYDLTEDEVNAAYVNLFNKMFDQDCETIDEVMEELENYTEDETDLYYELVEYEIVDYGFISAESITGLDLIDVSNLTTLSAIFTYCEDIIELDGLEEWDTSNVTSLNLAFSGCDALEDFSFLEEWDVSNVTDFTSTFKACCSAQTFPISDWDVSNGKKFENTFEECEELVSVDFSSWNTGNAETFEDIFHECTSLTDTSFENWNVENVVTFKQAFKTCESLTEVDLSSWVMTEGKNLQAMFEDCTSLETIDFSVTAAKFTNMSCLFSGCSSLLSFDFGDNLDSSKVTNMTSMFAECTSIETITIDLVTPSVVDFSNMFEECSATTIDISTFVDDAIQNGGSFYNMFYECEDLVTIYVGNNFCPAKFESSQSTFYSGNNLVGGNGTIFGANCARTTLYGRIDAPGQEGLFTLKA